MMNYEKRYPALSDTDKMPFGKFKGQPLQDVSPAYLLWLYESTAIKGTNPSLYNYIHNSLDAIRLELKGK